MDWGLVYQMSVCSLAWMGVVWMVWGSTTRNLRAKVGWDVFKVWMRRWEGEGVWKQASGAVLRSVRRAWLQLIGGGACRTLIGYHRECA